MAVSVLVMTPIGSFGELIQQALQETSLYRVELVREANQALEHLRVHDYPVAVVDFDLHADPAELVDHLYALKPDLRVIAIKDESESESSVLENLRIAQRLESPFYLPDLLDALEVVTADLVHQTGPVVRDGSHAAFQTSLFDSEMEAARNEAPEWLDDVSLAAIHLTQLSLQSTAKAALITRDAHLWAYAGHLPHPAAEELAQFVGQYWYRDGGSDFARFIRLDAVSGDYILYATGLGGDYVLALAFDIEIPFTKISLQAKELAKKLVNASLEDITIADDADSQPLDDEDVTAPVITDEILEEFEDEVISFPADWRPDQEIADSRQAFFEDLLSSIEIPEPDKKPLGSEDNQPDSIRPDKARDEGSTRDDEMTAPSDIQGFDSALEATKAGVDQLEQPGMQPVNDQSEVLPEGSSAEVISRVNDSLAATKPSILDQTQPDSFGQTKSTPNYLLETLATPLPEYLKDTIPTSVRGQDKKLAGDQSQDQEAQDGKSTYHQLTYACVLVPKLSGHHLVGDLAVFLNRCVLQVGTAFGWQLEHLSVRPNYLHWVIAIPPGTSPGYMVRIMRDHASHRIFTQFPQFARENQTGDFWASGYLIVNGKYPLSHQLVEDFIAKIRGHQVQPYS